MLQKFRLKNSCLKNFLLKIWVKICVRKITKIYRKCIYNYGEKQLAQKIR